MDHQSKSKTNALEQIYVHEVYNRLGSITLTQDTVAWPNVRKFLNRISAHRQHALVADVGCGTGKYLRLKSDLFTVGCDRSQPLCEITREKYSYLPIVIADNLHLPYRNDLFDAVLSIGVIHHLASHERRVQAIQECLRILKPDGGQLLIYTWAMEQKQRKFSSQDVLVPCSNPQPRSDMVLEEDARLSSLHMQDKLLARIEQENSPATPFSMIQSMQNLFQRMMRTPASSPSTPKLTHQDQLTFRLRPFPLSSYDNGQCQTNPRNQRFYHVFKRGELERLIDEASRTIVGSRIVKSYYDHGNWCAIVQKDSRPACVRSECDV